MKKFLAVSAIILALTACEKKENESAEAVNNLEEGEVIIVQPQFDVKFPEKSYKYNAAESKDCQSDEEIICAVDLVARCTVNPKQDVCDTKKMPRFIFMEDESLQRPTAMSFTINKIKPIDLNNVEVYTTGKCDGKWFGLCEGNIIYSLNNKNGFWVVKDIYAIE